MSLKKENGYFSLEACMVMPLVFYLLLFVIYAGFYQYDRCLLEQDIYRMLIRAGQVRSADNREEKKKIKEEDDRWYYDKYALCQIGTKNIEVDYGKIQIAQKAALRVNIPILTEWSGKPEWIFEANVICVRNRPVDTIRKCRKVEKFAKKGKRDD